MRLAYISLACKRKFTIQISRFDNHIPYQRNCGHIHYTTATSSRLQEYGVYLVGAASSRECCNSTVLSSFIAAGSRSHLRSVNQGPFGGVRSSVRPIIKTVLCGDSMPGSKPKRCISVGYLLRISNKIRIDNIN